MVLGEPIGGEMASGRDAPRQVADGPRTVEPSMPDGRILGTTCRAALQPGWRPRPSGRPVTARLACASQTRSSSGADCAARSTSHRTCSIKVGEVLGPPVIAELEDRVGRRAPVLLDQAADFIAPPLPEAELPEGMTHLVAGGAGVAHAIPGESPRPR